LQIKRNSRQKPSGRSDEVARNASNEAGMQIDKGDRHRKKLHSGMMTRSPPHSKATNASCPSVQKRCSLSLPSPRQHSGQGRGPPGMVEAIRHGQVAAAPLPANVDTLRRHQPLVTALAPMQLHRWASSQLLSYSSALWPCPPAGKETG
jgi:hypothetical protein